MDQDTEYIELVRRAQSGDKGSLDDLAELVRGRLYAYVYRIVLRDDVAQDIVQESMLEMFKILDKLEQAELFWPWLRGIGFNKIRHHRTREKRHRMVSVSSVGDGDWPEREGRTGLANLMGKELRQVVFNVMRRLKPQYRMVLAMRCYEDMQYAEIAELMGCSELSVRVLFCRAKKAMARQLSRRGFGKGALLAILALFGKMTAPSEAAAANVSVTAATANAGLAASLLGTAVSKEAVITLATAGLLAAGVIMSPAYVDKAFTWVEKSVVEVKERLASDPRFTAAGGLGDECWYYYPSQAGGPVMTRLVKYGSHGGYSYCQRLEDDEASYFFDRAENAIYINNYRMWRKDLSVRRLPTDGSDLREFLSMVEGQADEMTYVSSEGSGLLVIARQDGGEASNLAQVTHQYNMLDEEYFRYDWPGGVEVVDNRDAMHKRGWTYFRVRGRVNGEEVTGTGRMPFVYAASTRYTPWLRLQVGEWLEIADSAAGAYIHDVDGRAVKSYPAGTFFKGLARPWMGLHTIDTVRRDAAEQRIWFETGYRRGGDEAEVILTKEQGKLIYTIDMENDVVERVTFSVRDNQGRDAEGEILFSYLEEVEQVGNEFGEPRKKGYGKPQREEIGVLWLVRLAEGSLGQ
jgi:RNA polymerase sigma factor (sigma-70 family)